MRPDVVVDIGNSRIKWGRCGSAGGVAVMVSLAGDDPAEWDRQRARWELPRPMTWAVGGVQPHWQKTFAEWALARGDRVQEITHDHLPIRVDVESPLSVGIDRLLNAVAAGRLKPTGAPAVVIGAGTAVTVDLVKADGTFAGGTIFPGPRLMADSLHRFTAKLPLVELGEVSSREPPGKNTRGAIETGISHAILGGVSFLVERMAGADLDKTSVILTGGALGALAGFDFHKAAGATVRPTLTLEGLLIAAESLP